MVAQSDEADREDGDENNFYLPLIISTSGLFSIGDEHGGRG